MDINELDTKMACQIRRMLPTNEIQRKLNLRMDNRKHMLSVSLALITALMPPLDTAIGEEKTVDMLIDRISWLLGVPQNTLIRVCQTIATDNYNHTLENDK